MKVSPLICGAIVVATMPVAALADDPHDPAMRNAAARARDSEKTRELNRRENDRVVKTGVRWWTVRPDGSKVAGDGDYAAATRDYQRDRARYEQEMVDWRHAVAACRAGDRAACAN